MKYYHLPTTYIPFTPSSRPSFSAFSNAFAATLSVGEAVAVASFRIFGFKRLFYENGRFSQLIFSCHNCYKFISNSIKGNTVKDLPFVTTFKNTDFCYISVTFCNILLQVVTNRLLQPPHCITAICDKCDKIFLLRIFKK